ncbi:D-2-hydroxyacid dehydrogenase [Halanaerobium congolense]|uniref:Phosphoglycerate dehydrogenase n=1 Tax=Halanaerobium congolense TaxID=54121 RepID=A0A1G9X772_9FIRM|nr:D-2-hydroxyacid dehydrogenase [Halanaerobium congolense]OEG63533.1 MAG: hydroxyacid dehydrogenase [Halanaerobium sp. MDAL1]PUU91781.1 MAG: phosphoglycerate dehydrogenase-like oxidoreductase [Halanaerobium sp.]TDS30659.1 phosphoglycerate dehydrogenase-like enzyme [Halanaerobium congolense]SDI66350.1 Phosphoglycerate dehydrogenase [Halanaerobium congolense]SDK96286.1 Phosphoglycerate dehydrogenase [Halanaerobium congolense]
MNKILVIKNKIFDLPAGAEEKINKLDSVFELKLIDSQKNYLPLLKEAEIVFGWPKTDLVKKAEKLKWLHLPSAGVDRYANKDIYQNQDIKLTNSSGVYGKPIAEHVFAMIMAHNRNLIDYAYNKKEKKWQRKNEIKDFFNSTVGILGFGDIGSTIAKRAKAWGAEVLALKRTMIKLPDYVDQIYLNQDLDKLLRKSDYVILTLPGTPETEGIIGRKELKAMKKSAFIINIGRGSLINQKDLIEALEENWIAGAGLDVTEPEPLPEASKLWEMDNVILTPHTSGFSPTNDQRRFEIFKDNLKRYLNKEKLLNQVDFELKY